jgi:hypothetical protein
MRGRWLPSLVWWLGLTLPLAAQEGFRLEYKMEPGQVIKYRSWIKMAALNHMPRAAQPMRMQMEAETLYQERVLEATEETYTYEVETLSGHVLVRMGERERKQEVSHSRERTVMDRWGEVREKTELDEEGNPKPEEESDEPLEDPLLIVDRILEHAALPKRPVKPGDRWEHTVDIRIASDRTIPVTIRLYWKRWVRLMGRRCAEIQIRFSLPVSVSRSEEKMGSMEAQGQLTGEFVLYFDPDAGIDVLQIGRVEAGLVTRFTAPEALQERLGRELPAVEMKTQRVYHLKAVLEE